MRSRLLILVACIALAAGGCSGDGGGEASADGPAAAKSLLRPAPEAEEVLEQFVQAADNGDVDTMWGLLSEESREALGPTLEAFASEHASGFQTGLGSFAGTGYEVVVSAETAGGWGVVAIAGPRRRGDADEYASYGAALRRKEGEWRLELGAPVAIRKIAPPEQTGDSLPRIEVGIEADVPIEEAGLWLDGALLDASVSGEPEDVLMVTTPEKALGAGWHVLVVFGSGGELANAGATPFLVRGDSGPSGDGDAI